MAGALVVLAALALRVPEADPAYGYSDGAYLFAPLMEPKQTPVDAMIDPPC